MIIAFTAETSQGIEQTCQDAGMNFFISKPMDKEKFRVTVQPLFKEQRTST